MIIVDRATLRYCNIRTCWTASGTWLVGTSTSRSEKGMAWGWKFDWETQVRGPFYIEDQCRRIGDCISKVSSEIEPWTSKYGLKERRRKEGPRGKEAHHLVSVNVSSPLYLEVQLVWVMSSDRMIWGPVPTEEAHESYGSSVVCHIFSERTVQYFHIISELIWKAVSVEAIDLSILGSCLTIYIPTWHRRHCWYGIRPQSRPVQWLVPSGVQPQSKEFLCQLPKAELTETNPEMWRLISQFRFSTATECDSTAIRSWRKVQF